MPIEMSLFCSHETVTPSIQFGFKIPLVLLRDIVISPHHVGACTDAHIHTYLSTSFLSSPIRLEWWMVFVTYSRPYRNTEFSHPPPEMSCSLLFQKGKKKMAPVCAVGISLVKIKQQARKFELGVSGPHIDCLWRGRIKDTAITDFQPQRICFHLTHCLCFVNGCVLRKGLKNGDPKQI